VTVLRTDLLRTDLLRTDLLHPDWAQALSPVRETLIELDQFLAGENAAGRDFLPADTHILRAFSRPLSETRVLIIGQDPYPTPGHAIGLAFGVDMQVRPLPRSLSNIYRELRDDVGIPAAAHGDLSRWSAQGVMLLNRVLTVSPGMPGSHRGRGWETVTDAAVTALVRNTSPLIAILWGKDAARLRPHLGSTHVIESAHPSPLSAARGFWGSKPFSRANAALQAMGETPIDWRVDAVE